MTSYVQREQSEFKVRLIGVLFLLIFVLIFGMFFYHFAEGWSYINSLYYTTMSLTSRGYSYDLYPTHWYTVLFSVFFLLFGVTLTLYVVSNFISYYTAYYQKYMDNKFRNILNRMDQARRPEKWVFLKPKGPQ